MSDIPDDLLDIATEDPIEAIIAIDQRIRPAPNLQIASMDDVEIINRYHAILRYACLIFGVEFDIDPREADANGISEAQKLLYLIKTEIDKRKIDRVHAKFQSSTSISLDDNWREKIYSYISHVRVIVTKAQICEQIRELIMNKLHALDAEVDRTKTRIEKITDVLVELCKGVSAGANELKPAVALFERVVGAIANIWPPAEPTNPALPPPDTLGLPSPDAHNKDDDADRPSS